MFSWYTWSSVYYFEIYVSCLIYVSVFFFFKQKTAYEMRISDWSSDVCSSDLCRQNRKGRAEVERPVKDLQLARSGGRMRKRGIDIGGRRRNLGQQEQDDEDRRSDIKHDLDQVAPDHRIEAAHKSEGEAEDQQNKRGDDDMLGRDVEEEDHRNGDRSKIEARPAGKHPPDQIHGACRPASGRAEPGLEQFIDGGKSDERKSTRLNSSH